MADYQIGNHTFESEEEYKKALQDYDYARQFMQKLDLRKPEMAKKLYEQLAFSEHLMKSEIGEAFKEKLTEVFVKDCVRGKCSELQDKSYQTGREFLQEAKEDPLFWSYWCSFKTGFLMTTLSIVSNVIGTMHLEQQTFRILFLGSSFFGVITYYVILGLICATVALMIRELIQVFQHKLQAARRINFMLLCGSALLGCLIGLSQIRG